MFFQPQDRGHPTLTESLLESETEPRELSAEFVFLLSQFSACWASCHFPCAGFSSCSASTAGAFAELDFCCAWPLPRGGQAKVVSARLNMRNGTTDVWGVYNFLGSVSPHQKFEAIDRPSVTAQFYLESKGKSLRREGGLIQKMRREESQRLNFGSSFYGSVLSQQKYEVMDGPALQPSDRPEFQLHVTAQFYLESKGKYILEM